MKRRYFLVGLPSFGFIACSAMEARADAKDRAPTLKGEHTFEVSKSDAAWKKQLGDMEFRVMRQQDTERAFSGKLLKEKRKGTYHCGACDQLLFSSEHKFKSGTGWPSYWDVAKSGTVLIREDRAYGMTREETICSRCGAHLGHRFDDGPRPTRLRYCINSAALVFKPYKPSAEPAKTATGKGKPKK